MTVRDFASMKAGGSKRQRDLSRVTRVTLLLRTSETSVYLYRTTDHEVLRNPTLDEQTTSEIHILSLSVSGLNHRDNTTNVFLLESCPGPCPVP